jgi:hypothetical protein
MEKKAIITKENVARLSKRCKEKARKRKGKIRGENKRRTEKKWVKMT